MGDGADVGGDVLFQVEFDCARSCSAAESDAAGDAEDVRIYSYNWLAVNY